MKSNFPKALDAVLKHEGGYVDHPRDPGGATNLGITKAVLEAWRGRKVTRAEVRALGRKEAADIYRARFWTSTRCDELPAGLDYAVFDFAVNSGPGRAVRNLQAAVGAKRDGVIGGLTLAAVARIRRADAIRTLCDRRLAFVRALKTWPTFGKGWKRRVEEVRAAALALADIHAPTQTGEPS